MSIEDQASQLYEYSNECEWEDYVKAFEAILIQERRKAAFKELTMLGRLYNGSKKAYLDHYEARYRQLESNTEKEKQS